MSSGVLGKDVVLEIVDEGGGTGPDELLASGVDAIVGPASSRVALAQLSSIVQPETGVVTCSPTATALALDDFPDNGFFFRTAPSDSLQMAAIARSVRGHRRIRRSPSAISTIRTGAASPRASSRRPDDAAST